MMSSSLGSHVVACGMAPWEAGWDGSGRWHAAASARGRGPWPWGAHEDSPVSLLLESFIFIFSKKKDVAEAFYVQKISSRPFACKDRLAEASRAPRK